MSATPDIFREFHANTGEHRPDQIADLQNLYRADWQKLYKELQKINTILDIDELVEKIVNDVARSFGCVEAEIYLYDERRGELVLAQGIGCSPDGPGHRLKLGKDGMVGYVAVTRQMRYAPDVRLDPYYISCGPSPTLSEVAIPLQVGDELVGVFTASHPELDAFPPQQLRLLQALCNEVAVTVYNARRFSREQKQLEKVSREVREARAIQQALLPRTSPYVPGFEITGLSIPAGPVGGDWYDFIPLDDGCWGLVLADVSGKGLAAALLMSATRAMLRSLAEARCSPAEVLTELNRLLTQDFPAGKFVTMVYGVLDPARRTLTFANAGHPHPLLLTEGFAQCPQTEKGLPLGLGTSDFSEVTVELPKGSRLMFYSDGITEAVNEAEEEYGVRRLLNCFVQPQSSAEDMLQDVRRFASGARLRDDASIILVQA